MNDRFQMTENNPRNIPLIDLIKQSNMPTQLVNCISKAVINQCMPFQTIGDYLDAGSSSIGEMVKIEGMGYRNAAKLDDLVKAFFSNPDQYLSANSGNGKNYIDRFDRREDILQLLEKGYSLLEACWNQWRSVVSQHPALGSRRVSSILSEIGYELPRLDLAVKTLSDYCAYRLSELSTLPGIGATTRRYIVVAFGLCVHEFQQRTLNNDSSLRKKQSKTIPEEDAVLDPHLSPEEFFQHYLGLLTEFERQVITGRYGCMGSPRKTGKALAKLHNVSAERIRQVQMRVLKKLEQSPNRNALVLFVESRKQEMFKRLACGKHTVLRSQLREREQLLPGELRCAVAVLYGSVGAWLDEAATATREGWYMLPYKPEEVTSWINVVHEYCSQVALPQPLVSLVEPLGLSIDQLELVLDFSNEIHLVSGYVIKGNITRSMKRFIQAHLVMSP